jgi:hypothetical protein
LVTSSLDLFLIGPPVGGGRSVIRRPFETHAVFRPSAAQDKQNVNWIDEPRDSRDEGSGDETIALQCAAAPA